MKCSGDNVAENQKVGQSVLLKEAGDTSQSCIKSVMFSEYIVKVYSSHWKYKLHIIDDVFSSATVTLEVN